MFNINYSGKIKEAEDHVKQAEKHLKTSLTKWKPDVDSAIDELEKGCTCYRVAEKYDLCRDLSVRLANLQIQKGSTFFAGKSFEQAAQMSVQLNDLRQAANHFNRSGELLVEGGQRDSAAILYERSAPTFQQFDRSVTIDFFLKAARLAEQDEKWHQAADLYEKAALQTVRTGDFDKTSEIFLVVTKILDRIDRHDRLNRVVLYRVLLKLFKEDSVAARNVFEEACQNFPCFEQWEERVHLELLLEAFDQDDKDSISQRCQNPFFMAVDPEFVRLMKLWVRAKPSEKEESKSTSNNSVKPIQLDDDDIDLR